MVLRRRTQTSLLGGVSDEVVLEGNDEGGKDG